MFGKFHEAEQTRQIFGKIQLFYRTIAPTYKAVFKAVIAIFKTLLSGQTQNIHSNMFTIQAKLAPPSFWPSVKKEQYNIFQLKST